MATLQFHLLFLIPLLLHFLLLLLLLLLLLFRFVNET